MRCVVKKTFVLTFVSTFVFLSGLFGAEPKPTGVPVSFQLPTAGTLPKTYRVTLAAVDKDNPEWIFGSIIAGKPFTVTAENQGKFTVYWNGLDDNYMPMPPGDYGVKGIYMPAEKWELSGRYQTLIPQYKCGISSWLPTKENDRKPFLVRGHGMWPWLDVHVTPAGKAVMLHAYMENGRHPIILDLTKPIGYDQVSKSLVGASGGFNAVTDGNRVWVEKFIIHGVGFRFGNDKVKRNNHVTEPLGKVQEMDLLMHNGKPLIYTAQRFKMKEKGWRSETEEPVNVIVVYGGDHPANVLAKIPIPFPKALSVVPERKELYVLHQPDGVKGAWAISRTAIGDDGLPKAEWQRVTALDADAVPRDIAVDHEGHIFISYPEINQVIAYAADGTESKRFGEAAKQTPGAYNPEVFMHPTSVERWRGKDGKTRVLVLETAGPNRLSEWTADGTLIRQWIPEQIHSVGGGVATDPANRSHVYVRANSPEMGGINRFVVDYETGTWKLDAVYPGIAKSKGFPGGGGRFWIYNVAGRKYMVFGRMSVWVYRMHNGAWVPSAALVGRKNFWHDANGDGNLQKEEFADLPAKLPTGLKYHGQNFLPDLSLLLYERGAPAKRAWRLKPRGFDKNGNPIYHGDDWKAFLIDSVAERKEQNKAVAGYGANEIGLKQGSSWDYLTGDDKIGYWWKITAGNYSANVHNQIKINRFIPDGNGGFKHVARFGRGTVRMGPSYAMEDAMMGGMHINRPVHGLIGVLDASIATYWVYTEDGLYVDRIFPNAGWGAHREKQGMYAQPGEHFHNGDHFLDPKSGQVVISMGKVTPQFFTVPNWKPGIVKRLKDLDRKITLQSNHVVTPPNGAIALRGGIGRAPLAKVYPALGGVALDGSTDGWLDAVPVRLQKDKNQAVTVQCKYDPDHLYLRIRAVLGREHKPTKLAPAQRLFTHDRGSDTISLYFQGDPMAKPAKSRNGRAGDVRLVFGIFDDQGKVTPAVLGMYPKYGGKNAKPMTYASPVGNVPFEHVALLPDVTLGHSVDKDGKGFVIAAKIPRSVLGAAAFSGSSKTMINFDATFGQSKFWWANTANKASTETYDEPSEAALYPASWAPAQWVPVKEGVRRVNTWLIAGPFKGVHVANRRDWKHINAGVKKMRQLHFPPDEWPIDYQAKFPKHILHKKVPDHWHLRRLNDGQNVTVLTWAFQMSYASCWVHVPRDVKMPALFHHANESYNTIKLNGEKITLPHWQRGQEPKLTFDLRKGWNNIWFRGFTRGRPLRIGIDFLPPKDLLWVMKITPTPQKLDRVITPGDLEGRND